MSMRKHIPAVTALVTLVGLFVWGSASAAELVVWHAYRGAERAAFEKVAEIYNAQSSGTKVKLLAVPFDAYADKITAAVPRGRGPDVFIFAQDRLGGWVEGGQTIEPIDFFIEDETLEQFLPNMMDAMTYRGTVYGLPFNYKSITLIYNKALVPTPPATSGELVEVAKRLTNVPTGKFGLAYEFSNYFFHAALMNAFGGAVFDANANPTIDRQENIDAINLMLRWYRDDGFLPADPSAALISTLFNTGNAAMVFSGPWFLAEIQPGVDYGLAPLPKLDELDGEPMRPWLTIEGVYVSAASKHKEEAYDFATFLVSKEAALVMALEGRQLPTNRHAYEDDRVATDPVLAAFRKQLETAVPMPNFAEMTLMWSPVTTAMNRITRGSATPEAALATAQEQVAAGIAALRRSN